MPAVRNIHRLIDHFSGFTTVPIDPDDVAAQIISFGVKDEIEYVGVDIDTRVIYGAYKQYTFRNTVYGDPIVHVDIYYDRSLTRDWRRVVCCKELLHILDHSISKSSTQQDCEKLVEHLAAFDYSSPFSDEKLQAWNDELMTFYAMAVLLPWDAREILREDFLEDESRFPVIVEKCDLPIADG
jgi:hypothetical protein